MAVGAGMAIQAIRHKILNRPFLQDFINFCESGTDFAFSGGVCLIAVVSAVLSVDGSLLKTGLSH